MILGVPEVWRYTSGHAVLVLKDGVYRDVERSPTTPGEGGWSRPPRR